MSNKYRLLFFLVMAILFVACDEDNAQFPATLNVFHGLVRDAPALHVDYFEQDFPLSNNPALEFGEADRLTLPTNTERNIFFISAEDTLTQVYQETVSFQPGEIHSLFLTGDLSSAQGVLVRDAPLALKDSLIGVRFVNLSPDSGPVSIGIAGVIDPIEVNLGYQEASSYLPLPASAAIGAYTFEFKAADGTILGTSTTDLLPDTGQIRVFKNMTFLLIGLRDNGTLEVSRMDNF